MSQPLRQLRHLAIVIGNQDPNKPHTLRLSLKRHTSQAEISWIAPVDAIYSPRMDTTPKKENGTQSPVLPRVAPVQGGHFYIGVEQLDILCGSGTHWAG